MLHKARDHLIESPCVAVCKLDAEGRVCTGCYRTTEEITIWALLDGDAKRRVISDAALRKQAQTRFMKQ